MDTTAREFCYPHVLFSVATFTSVGYSSPFAQRSVLYIKNNRLYFGTDLNTLV